MARAVHLALTPGTPETGIWCEPCALPSVVRVPFYNVNESGVSLVAAAAACTECGAR